MDRCVDIYEVLPTRSDCSRTGLSSGKRSMQYSGREAIAIADPEHGSCRHRSCKTSSVSAFFRALGYSPEDWRRLEADLWNQHLSQDAVLEGDTSYGQKYTIRATLVGPSGQSADVVSVWVVRRGEEFPRFVTAYPEGDK